MFAPPLPTWDNTLMELPTDPQTAVSDITAQLGETSPEALWQIGRIVKLLGIEAAYTYLHQTLDIEQGGGMLTKDNGRRRTPGGIFFHLIRTHVSAKERRLLFPYRPPEPKGETAVSVTLLPLPDRQQLLHQAMQQPGELKSMKTTLIARPGKVIDRDTYVAFTVTGKEPPALPKGLPPLPDKEPSVYLVYVAKKQWKKVEPALQNPEDRLVIEGHSFHDKKLGVIGILTQSVVSLMQQRAQKTAQQEQTQNSS